MRSWRFVWLTGGAARRLSKRAHATGRNGLSQVLAHRNARIRLVAACRDALARAMAHAGPAKIGESNHSNAQSRWLCVRELRTFTCHSLKTPVDTPARCSCFALGGSVGMNQSAFSHYEQHCLLSFSAESLEEYSSVISVRLFKNSCHHQIKCVAPRVNQGSYH